MPTNQGLDATALEAMMDDIGSYPVIDSIAISRNDRLVFDETIRTVLNGHDDKVANTDLGMHAQFSVSKGITSLVVGIAIDEGYISDVEVPYLDLFPLYGLRQLGRAQARYYASSCACHAVWPGLETSGDPPYSSAENQWNRFYNEEHDFSKALLDLPLAADPGTAFCL